MATTQTTVRFNPATLNQITALQQHGWGNTVNILALAVDRLYKAEIAALTPLEVMHGQDAAIVDGIVSGLVKMGQQADQGPAAEFIKAEIYKAVGSKLE